MFNLALLGHNVLTLYTSVIIEQMNIWHINKVTSTKLHKLRYCWS